MANNQLTTLVESFIEDSGTNTVVAGFNGYHRSSGTPASGLGWKIGLGAENSAGTDKTAAEIQGYLTTVTNAAEDGAFKLQVRVAGTLQDALTVSGGSSSATIGSGKATVNLWNTTATAVNAFGAATAVTMGGGTSAVISLNALTTGQVVSVNSATAIKVVNTSTATGAYAAIYAGNADNSAAAINMICLGTNFTTAGAFVQDGGAVYANSSLSGGLSIAAVGASADVRVYAGGSATTDLVVTFGNNLVTTFADAADIAFNTTTGTKIGTATTQKLAFYNSTPIAQPSATGETTGFTAGAGTTVNDASTFTGNVGSTAYRINDIVKHLKNLGLIAA